MLSVAMKSMEQQALKNVNNCLNINIYSHLEMSCSQSSNLYLNVVHLFNTSVYQTSVAAKDSCFPALGSNTSCAIMANVIMQIVIGHSIMASLLFFYFFVIQKTLLRLYFQSRATLIRMSYEQPRQVYAYISMGLGRSQLAHKRVAHN